MATKLVQKHLLKGSREFEIVDDAVNVRIKTPFNNEETLTVMLAVLNPEPVIRKSLLEFTSRVNNEPLLSLFLAKPNPEEFNAFVNLLKRKTQDEFDAFAGLKSGSAAGLERNSFEEPPEFDEPGTAPVAGKKKQLRPEDIERAIGMLQEHLDGQEIGQFVAALEKLHSDPMNDGYLAGVVDEFKALGPLQGAVLSYAPYVIAVLSDDPYEDL